MPKKTTTTKKTTAKEPTEKKVTKAAAKASTNSSSLVAPLFDSKGKSNGEVSLPESVFGLPWNSDMVHQTVTSMQMNTRDHFAHTKTRGEVRGGGKKPWQQKGTGRARHGSTRSPIWVGGGVAHGPRNDKNFARKVNKQMKTQALFTILSQKARDGEVLCISGFELKEGKTKFAKELVTSIAKNAAFAKLNTKRVNTALLIVPEKDSAVSRAFSNFGNMEVCEVRNVNPVTAIKYKYVVIGNPDMTLAALNSKNK